MAANRQLVCVVALVTGAIAGGCVNGVTNADPSVPSSLGSNVVTVDDLLFAPVPALCRHDPGNLVNGHFPAQDRRPGNVAIATNPPGVYSVALGDLTGNGKTDAAMVTECDAGGVAWSQTVQLYAPGPTWLGGIDLGELTHGGRERVIDLSISDGVAHVTWLTHGPADPACCPAVKMTGDLRRDGSMVVAAHVHRLN